MDGKEMAKFACEVLYSKKASDIIEMDVTKMTVISDYMVIASAKSTTQVRALAEAVDEKFSEQGIEPLRTEGIQDGRWAVLDYGDLIVHVFNDESRVFYCLERLWDQGDNVTRYNG